MLLMTRLTLTRRVSLPLSQALRTQSTVPLENNINRSTENNVRPFKDMPGPKGLPYIGSIHRYIMAGGFQYMHKVNQKLFEEFGPIFKETLFGSRMVHVLDPDESAKVFRSEGKYPRRTGIDSINYVIQEQGVHSIAARDGPEWKHLRKAVQSKMMRPKELYVNIQNFNRVVDDALESIRSARGRGNSEGEVPNLLDELQKWAMESIGTLVFDFRIGLYKDPPKKEALESIEAIKGLFESAQKLESGIERMFYRKFSTPSLNRLRKDMTFSRDFARKYVEAKIDEMKEDLKNPEKLLHGEGITLLSYLLAKGDLSNEEIADSCVDMILAGVDTTSVLVLSALYRLATNQDVQERLRHEIETVIGKDGELTSKDMEKIPYMKAFIKELLRLDGIGFNVPRILNKDIVLCGYNVPAGMPIFTNNYATVRSEIYFEDAERFKPERWLRGSGEEIHPFASLPFGFGPRMCVGKRAAELEVILFLSKVAQRFKLEYNHKPVGKVVTLFLRPAEDNIKINFIDID